MKTYSIVAIALVFLLSACTRENVDASAKENTSGIAAIKGSWKLVNVFLSDAIDRPCGQDSLSKDITLVVTDEPSNSTPNTFSINGQSAVNLFFGSVTITSYDNNTHIGTVKMSALGSTKMAGTPEMNQCEQGYFDKLSTATDFSLAKDASGKTLLYLGIFKKNNTPSRDGGVYLIYEKIK